MSETIGFVQIYEIREGLENKDIVYPDYYLKPFHAYDQGNLDWTAAFEAELATMSIGLRTFKDEEITPEEAQRKLRAGPLNCLKVC